VTAKTTKKQSSDRPHLSRSGKPSYHQSRSGHRTGVAMTVYEDVVERKRTRRGTKVLVLACGILAVLGSFWGIVWFIRSYVEPPRVMAPAPLSLAARESRPAPAPTPALDTKLSSSESATAPQVIQIQATQAPAALPPAKRAQTPAASSESPASAGVADRWAPMDQFAPPPPAIQAPPPAAVVPSDPAPVSLVAAVPEPDGIIVGSVSAIEGRVPLPRRKPTMTASVRRDPPMPRPRPEAAGAPVEQSVWTAVPPSDDRYQTGTQ
jgi:hypothetical protein